MARKPTKTVAPRNPYVVPAKHRQAGSIESGPRGGARNEEREWLEEWAREAPESADDEKDGPDSTSGKPPQP